MRSQASRLAVSLDLAATAPVCVMRSDLFSEAHSVQRQTTLVEEVALSVRIGQLPGLQNSEHGVEAVVIRMVSQFLSAAMGPTRFGICSLWRRAQWQGQILLNNRPRDRRSCRRLCWRRQLLQTYALRVGRFNYGRKLWRLHQHWSAGEGRFGATGLTMRISG